MVNAWSYQDKHWKSREHLEAPLPRAPVRAVESLFRISRQQIANLVSEGLSNKEGGLRLNLTRGTIKVHLHNIFSKLAINNRAALTDLAVYDRYKIFHDGRRQISSAHQAAQPNE